jgi:L-amino acid N-acyltransferase YncA
MPEHELQLRKFEKADRATLEPWFDPEPVERSMGGRQWLGSAVRDTQNEPDTTSVLVVWRDREPVAVFSGWRSKCRAGSVAVSIAVPPGRYRTGLGTQASHALLAADELRDVDEFLAYVQPGNDAGEGLVKSLGFHEYGHIDGPTLYVAWRDGRDAIPEGWKPPPDAVQRHRS